MKSINIVYLSILFSFFCLEFDYLVTLCMEKVYGEIFYTHLEGNILVQQTHNINVILFPLFIILIIFVIYLIINYIILKHKKSYVPLDLVFCFQFIFIGTVHLNGGLSWFLNGWF